MSLRVVKICDEIVRGSHDQLSNFVLTRPVPSTSYHSMAHCCNICCCTAKCTFRYSLHFAFCHYGEGPLLVSLLTELLSPHSNFMKVCLPFSDYSVKIFVPCLSHLSYWNSFLSYLLHSHHLWCPFTLLHWSVCNHLHPLPYFDSFYVGSVIFLFLLLSHVQMVDPSSCYFHTFLSLTIFPPIWQIWWPLSYCLQTCFLLETSLSCIEQWPKSPLLQDYQPFQGFWDISWFESS